jgi:parvulin-like peptidyl-prolyl isomerase
MRKTGLLTLGLSLVSATAVQNVASATELARVRDTVITLEEFNKKYKENLRFFQNKPPTKQNVLDDIINREVGIQEAKRLKLDKDPEVIDRINTVLFHALVEKALSKDIDKIHVTSDEAKSYYQKNPDIRTSHIFVALRPDASAEEQKKALEKIKKIQDQYLDKEKMSFAEAAQRFSESADAPMGGDTGYQSKNRLDPLYYEAALKLGSPGKVSGIVKTQEGYNIIKLTEIRSWEDSDQTNVKRMVFEEEKNKLFQKYINRLRDQAKVVVHPELLKE